MSSCAPATIPVVTPTRYFEPVEGYNSVCFAAPGVEHEIVVTRPPLEVATSEVRQVPVLTPVTQAQMVSDGEPVFEDVDVPINEALISALDAHPNVIEVAAPKGKQGDKQ